MYFNEDCGVLQNNTGSKTQHTTGSKGDTEGLRTYREYIQRVSQMYQCIIIDPQEKDIS